MPDAESVPAIDVSAVSKAFGAVVALDRVSFSVTAGEMFFLLGPSGCGKTTLLRILAGLERPDSGTIRFAGRDIADLLPHERGAPMVFQNYALWPHLNVRENVAFGLVERRVPKSEAAGRVTAALAKVGLEGYGERMPAQLSGGQQQRVVLARALVLNPRVVLLDEPLSNLDAKLRAEMREEIERLHRETDITFVYVTHDQTEALSLADRMAVMQAGRISAVGAPRELYHRPPNTFCAGFLGEANMIAGRVAAVEGGAVRVETPFGVWRAIFGGSRLPAVGERIECMVRPENLRAAPTADANMLDAVVKSTRMNGATVTVVLEAAGLSLKATVLNQPSLDLQPGASGRWFLDASHTVTLLRE